MRNNDAKYTKLFYRLETLGADTAVDEMQDISDQMKKTLYAIADKTIPNNNYTTEELKEYCRSLIDGQYFLNKNDRSRNIRTLKSGNWTLISDISGMPVDARVDFVFFPTYIAVATLCRLVLDYPEIALRQKGILRALRYGFLFSTYRNLNGHGYTATDEMLDALEIFCIGGVPVILNEYHDLSQPKLKSLIEKKQQEMIDRLSSGNTKGGWMTDYTERFKNTLQLLHDSC